jgi:hypothetical protein
LLEVPLDSTSTALVHLELDHVVQIARERPALALGELCDFIGVACDRRQLERAQQDRERCHGLDRAGHAATSDSNAS